LGPNDVYLRLCHLALAAQASPDRFVVEVGAVVNIVWAQAKFLRDVLADAWELDNCSQWISELHY
jgi:hypothetical protein